MEKVLNRGFPGGTSGKELICQCRRHKSHGFDPWVGKIPWRRVRQPTPVFSPGGSHEQESLEGSSPQVAKSGTWLKWLSTHTYTISFHCCAVLPLFLWTVYYTLFSTLIGGYLDSFQTFPKTNIPFSVLSTKILRTRIVKRAHLIYSNKTPWEKLNQFTLTNMFIHPFLHPNGF